MPAGLQVFNAQGVDILDITSNLGLHLGTIETGTKAGSIVVPGFAQGTPFYMIQGENPAYAGTNAVPNVTISGTTLSWSWPHQYGYFSSVIIIYGIF